MVSPESGSPSNVPKTTEGAQAPKKLDGGSVGPDVTPPVVGGGVSGKFEPIEKPWIRIPGVDSKRIVLEPLTDFGKTTDPHTLEIAHDSELMKIFDPKYPVTGDPLTKDFANDSRWTNTVDPGHKVFKPVEEVPIDKEPSPTLADILGRIKDPKEIVDPKDYKYQGWNLDVERSADNVPPFPTISDFVDRLTKAAPTSQESDLTKEWLDTNFPETPLRQDPKDYIYRTLSPATDRPADTEPPFPTDLETRLGDIIDRDIPDFITRHQLSSGEPKEWFGDREPDGDGVDPKAYKAQGWGDRITGNDHEPPYPSLNDFITQVADAVSNFPYPQEDRKKIFDSYLLEDPKAVPAIDDTGLLDSVLGYGGEHVVVIDESRLTEGGVRDAETPKKFIEITEGPGKPSGITPEIRAALGMHRSNLVPDTTQEWRDRMDSMERKFKPGFTTDEPEITTEVDRILPESTFPIIDPKGTPPQANPDTQAGDSQK